MQAVLEKSTLQLRLLLLITNNVLFRGKLLLGSLMKLQACSKIITYTALGFTLMAAGAFYALNHAQNYLENNYSHELQLTLDNVGSDLNHYVQRINSDYYQLINLSLTNILSLDQSYYQKDPLLAFFDHNIRNASPYSRGENLSYALEALNYFKVPYISYNFKTDKIEVHGAQDDKQKERMLRARAQDGSTLTELIKERPNLAHSFSIFYTTADFMLCLKLYDQELDTTYYVVSSYLNVLNNTVANIRNVFADINPMMAGILKGDEVMIVRHGHPIFSSEHFELPNVDLKTSHLRKLVGVRLINEQGQVITDAKSITSEQVANGDVSVVGTSYLRSINSYLILKRPFTLEQPSSAHLLYARLLLVLLALVSFALIVRIELKDGNQTRKERIQLGKLARKANSLSLDEFRRMLTDARSAVAATAAAAADSAANTAAETAAGSTAASAAPEAAADDTSSARKDYDNQAAAAAADSNQTAVAAQGTTAKDSPAESDVIPAASERKKRRNKHRRQGEVADTSREQDTAGSTTAAAAALPDAAGEQAEAASDRESASDQSAASAAASAAAPDMAAADSKSRAAAVDADSGTEGTAGDNSERAMVPELTEDDSQLVEAHLIKEFLKGESFDSNTLEGRLATSSLRLAHALDNSYLKEIAALKQELKSRIPVYRKEGQFIAARLMLLSALPSEDAMPSSNFVDFAAFTVPARELSGNFYTIRRLDENNLAFVIGDCDSQGIKAAYTVSVVNILVEEALKLDLDPPQVMRYLNERLCEMSNISSVALFIGMISEKTGNIIAANAGHCVPICVDDKGPHFIAEPNHKRLGVNKNEEFEQLKCFMANDDMLVLYSNGIINVRNAEDEVFGMERFMEHCDLARSLRADELVIKILNDIKLHKGKRPFRQDVSLICLKQLRISF